MVTFTENAHAHLFTRPKKRCVIISARVQTFDQRRTKRLHGRRVGNHDAPVHRARIAVPRAKRVFGGQADRVRAFGTIATRRTVPKQWRRTTPTLPASTSGTVNDGRFRGVFLIAARVDGLRRLAAKHHYDATNYRKVKPFHVMLLVCRRRRMVHLQKRRSEPLGECSRNHRFVLALLQAKYRAIPHAKASCAVRVQSVITLMQRQEYPDRKMTS
jgi:hypothetical protein